MLKFIDPQPSEIEFNSFPISFLGLGTHWSLNLMKYQYYVVLFFFFFCTYVLMLNLPFPSLNDDRSRRYLSLAIIEKPSLIQFHLVLNPSLIPSLNVYHLPCLWYQISAQETWKPRERLWAVYGIFSPFASLLVPAPVMEAWGRGT